MTDEKLIELVKQYSVLYDLTRIEYRDQNIRNNAWEEIAEELHTTVDMCKERWGKLRNCYTNALKRRRKKHGQGSSSVIPWKFETQMEFLLPHVEGRRNIKNLSSGNIDNDFVTQQTFSEEENIKEEESVSSPDNAWTPVFSSDVTFTPKRTLTPNQNLKINNDTELSVDMVNASKTSHETGQKRVADMDETDHFFLSMSKQIKKLPRIDQARIKFELHKLVYESEINMLNKQEKM